MKQIKLVWGGQEYTVTPTMKLLATIEMDLEISIVGLAVQISKSKVPPFAAISEVLAAVLQSAGATVTSEDVWNSINDWESDQVFKVLNMITAIIDSFNPEPPERIKRLVKAKKPRARKATTQTK